MGSIATSLRRRTRWPWPLGASRSAPGPSPSMPPAAGAAPVGPDPPSAPLPPRASTPSPPRAWRRRRAATSIAGCSMGPLFTGSSKRTSGCSTGVMPPPARSAARPSLKRWPAPLPETSCPPEGRVSCAARCSVRRGLPRHRWPISIWSMPPSAPWPPRRSWLVASGPTVTSERDSSSFRPAAPSRERPRAPSKVLGRA